MTRKFMAMRSLMVLVALLYGAVSAYALVPDKEFCSSGFSQPARMMVPGANSPENAVITVWIGNEQIVVDEPLVAMNDQNGLPFFIFRDRVFWPCEKSGEKSGAASADAAEPEKWCSDGFGKSAQLTRRGHEFFLTI